MVTDMNGSVKEERRYRGDEDVPDIESNNDDIPCTTGPENIPTYNDGAKPG